MNEQIVRSAVISDCGTYRYELRRQWAASGHMLPVCMLNPSTADHEKDDPTLLALIHFGRAWGYAGLLVVNLFAMRTSSPAKMRVSEDALGPKNASFCLAAIEHAVAGDRRLLAAWGNDGAEPTATYDARDEWFCNRAFVAGVDLICLGTTGKWRPKHPMARGKHRIPRDQQPIIWRSAQ